MILTGTVTNEGDDLYAAAFGKTIKLTRAEIGSERAANMTELAAQTALPSPIKEATITDEYSENNVTHVRVQLNNVGITAPTPFCQIGLYASLDDKPEVLLFAANVTEDVTLPAENPRYPILTEDILINLAHGNSSEFSANVDLAAFVTVGMLDRLKTEMGKNLITLAEDEPDDWRLWLEDLGDIATTDALILNTAPYDADSEFSTTPLDGGAPESVTNLTENAETAANGDIILAGT